MGNNKKTIITTSVVASLGLAAIPVIAGLASASAIGADGQVQLNTEVSTSIAMKIASPNDTNPDCMPQAGVTYGVANRYATSNGAEGSKQVDTFDGTTGGADEINTNTSCAKLSMTPNTFTSTYSDVTVYTNSPSGYAISLQSAEPNLVNVTDNTKNIPAGTLTESNGTTAGGQNAWSFKTDNGIITSWAPVSATDTTIKSYDQETDQGSTTRVTYGISAGNTPTGTYATDLTYTATMFDGTNPHVGQIDIDPVSNLTISPMNLKIAKNVTKTVTVTPASGYYLSSLTCPTGYTCTGYTTDKSDPASAAAQTITIKNESASSTSVTLGLAVTKLAEYMQDFSAAAHASDATGTEYTLADSRDENEYTTAKLADGNVWMTQNLRLQNYTLKPTDSNVSSNFTIPASSTANWCTTNSAACDDQAMTLDSGNASYGTYYNWYTATAGQGTYSKSSGDVSASICPKGWRLPTSTEFVTISNQYGSSASLQATGAGQPAFVLSGIRNGSSTYDQGSYGYYWSSTAYDSNRAYYLDLSSSNVDPQNYSYKYFGFSVRCVASS